jgi:hypothetical protein
MIHPFSRTRRRRQGRRDPAAEGRRARHGLSLPGRFAVFAVLSWSAWAEAEDIVVQIELQIPLLTNVLHFDRALRDRSGDELVVLVAFQPAYNRSREVTDKVRGIVGVGTPMVHGKPVRWEFAAISSAQDLRQAIGESGADVLYLTPLRAVDVTALTEVASRARVLSVSAVPEYSDRGAVVAFGSRASKPVIQVNLEAARAAGAELGAQLLQVAEIVRR